MTALGVGSGCQICPYLPARCRCAGMARGKPCFPQPGRAPAFPGVLGPRRAGTTTPGVLLAGTARSRLRTRRRPARDARRPGPSGLALRPLRGRPGPVGAEGARVGRGSGARGSREKEAEGVPAVRGGHAQRMVAS